MAATALLAAGAMALSACGAGSAGSSGAASGGGDPACVQAADEYLNGRDALPTTLPASFTPLATRPDPGKRVIKILNAKIPSEAQDAAEVGKAAAVVGWSLETYSFDGTVEDLVRKWNTAIEAQPDAIIADGQSPAVLGQQLEAAKAAGVVVQLGFLTDQPTSYPGFAVAVFGEETFKARGRLLAYQFMRATGCSGHTISTSLVGYPIQTAEVEGFKSALQQHCPACRVTDVPLQASDIGTPAVPTAIISALQADPSITYVYLIIGDLGLGVSGAAAAAGLTDLTFFGSSPTLDDLKALESGAAGWWATQNPEFSGWVSFDALLRTFATRTVQVAADSDTEALLTSQNLPPNLTAVPIYPLDFREQFTRLWTTAP